jgi:hypothetical protein
MARSFNKCIIDLTCEKYASLSKIGLPVEIPEMALFFKQAKLPNSGAGGHGSSSRMWGTEFKPHY